MLKRRSISFYKNHKLLDSLKKLLPALASFYLSGAHLTDCVSQSQKLITFLSPEIRFEWRSFRDQFKTSRIKLINYGFKNAFVVAGSAISSNFGPPSFQKSQAFVLSVLSGPSFRKPVGHPSAQSSAANAATGKPTQNRLEIYVQFILNTAAVAIGGIMGGAIGFFGYLICAGGIALSKRGSRAKPIISIAKQAQHQAIGVGRV